VFRNSTQETARLDSLLSGFEGQLDPEDVERAKELLEVHTGSFLDEKFAFTGMEVSDRRLYLIQWGCLVGFLTCTTAFFFSVVSAILVGSFFAWLGFRSIGSKAAKRAAEFEKDYTAFLLSLASSVRTGLDPIVAFYSCGRLFEAKSLIRVELEHFKELLESGMREEDALRQFAATIDLSDISLLRTAVILARQEGASLAQCLQRLARVTRQRQSFRRKIKAALAMQRLSAFGISGCAIIIGIFQVITNPEGIGIAFAHPIGRSLLLGGAGLMMIGLVWMLQLAKSKE
jgi:Flp pilus assembly protein TadB